jgi:CubicO group peptidase (beta-lactamase class C family)
MRSDAVLLVLDEKLPGCSAAVGIDGVVAWSGSRGLANLTTGEQLTATTVYDIGSVSKQFTATAALLLEIDGELALTDTVADHLAGLPAWAGRVTIEQLIHHTSGIPEYLGLLRYRGVTNAQPLTQAETVKALYQVKDLHFEPGEYFEYSNSNYLLLAEIVAVTSGRPLPRFLQERVFRPLGLGMVMDPARKVAGKAVSYEDGARGPEPFVGLWQDFGARGVLSSIGDLVRWADNYRTGTVGGQRLLDAQIMSKPVRGNADSSIDTRSHYGAGIVVQDDRSLVHSGGSDGFRTLFVVLPDQHTTVAVSCNYSKLAPEPLENMHKQLREIWS